jgi:hypothetical protein
VSVRTLRAADLFCGAGGTSTGLIWTGVAVGLVPGVTAARFGRVVEREDAQR